MSITSIIASCEASLTVTPATILIQTSDTLATVRGTGYLNSQTMSPCGFLGSTPTFANGQLALVNTTDAGTVLLAINISGVNTSLVPPNVLINSVVTAPAASSSSSLALGTSYQNTLGYDVMLSVYLNITSALSASVLLGVGSTSTPTQQTLFGPVTLSVLSIIPINIYLPADYYAKLSTSGTIVSAIAGQIAMPI